MSSFQAASTAQGAQFAAQCDFLLQSNGFEVQGALLVPGVGVEVDRVAVTPRGRTIWFEYKGSIQGPRPGLRRTDTLKKAIANGALLRALGEHPPFVVLTSHLPEAGAGLAMLNAAVGLGYVADIICIYDPAQAARISQL